MYCKHCGHHLTPGANHYCPVAKRDVRHDDDDDLVSTAIGAALVTELFTDTTSSGDFGGGDTPSTPDFSGGGGEFSGGGASGDF